MTTDLVDLVARAEYTDAVQSWLCLLLVSGCGFAIGGNNAGTDGSVTGDGAPDAPLTGEAGADAQLCYGTGFGRTCLDSAPAAARTLVDGAFDTDGAGCTQVTNNLCILAATDLDVAAATIVHVEGARPLVLVATNTIRIVGTIGASSVANEPSGSGLASSPCAAPAAASSDSGGAAGGAGGSFGGVGGSGGAGDLNNSGAPAGSVAGQGAASAVLPTTIRAGCTGGAGGTGIGSGGAGGRGGGAIYFIAGASITVTVTGRVFAVGEGGRSGNNLGAGGGGGSGGLLGFDAPMISFSGVVIANGGGGGEGAGTGSTGAPGGDGAASGGRALGGVSGTAGGNGGDSSGAGALDGITGQSVNEGGGGGGGGAGVIYIKGNFSHGASIISPAPNVTP